nr:hypothetical protein [Tanacetum cinerariifolium]
VIRKLRGETNVMKARELAREEEYEGLQAKCKVAMTDFDKNPAVNLSSWESKIASLETEKANLKATEALLRQEIKEVKHDRREVVSKVVPYACMELLHGDELADAFASVEDLLSKKPLTLQNHVPSRTQMLVPSSQLANPSFAHASKPMSPHADIVKPSPTPND